MSITEIRNLFPKKEMIIVFPPERISNELKSVASSSFALGHGKLQECQFAPEVTDKYGTKIRKSASWG